MFAAALVTMEGAVTRREQQSAKDATVARFLFFGDSDPSLPVASAWLIHKD